MKSINVLVSAILFGGLPREMLTRVLRGETELVTGVPLIASSRRVTSPSHGRIGRGS